MSDSFPWMPLYTGDYLRDTVHLNATSHGGYMLLLMHAWNRGGDLPGDADRLRALARMTGKQWETYGPTILEFFYKAENGYRHKRVDAELERVATMRGQRQLASMAATLARKEQRKANEINSDTLPSGDRDVYRSVTKPQPHSEREEQSPLETGATAAPHPEPPRALPVRDQLWADGPRILAGLTGKPQSACRAFLGRTLKAAGDDCALILTKLHVAEQDRPLDAFAWITAATKPQPKQANFASMIRAHHTAPTKGEVIDATPFLPGATANAR